MNYEAIAVKVAAKIQKEGKAATIIRPGTEEGWTKKFNALTGTWYWENGSEEIVTEDPATATEIDCYVLEDRFEIRHIDGTLVEVNDRLFLCTEQPVLGDTLEVGSDELTVVRVVPLQPGDTVIYSEVQAR